MNWNNSYFIPDSVSVGMFSSGAALASAEIADRLFSRPSAAEFGFVTCRFKYGQWISPGVFERLTKGFKPTNQRDRAAQLKKTVTGAVSEIKNEPITGFRLVAWGANPYRYCTKDYGYSGDVVFEDPRGFCIALPQSAFFATLAMSGINLADGMLTGKYVYGWNMCDKSITLIPEAHSEYAKWLKLSDGFRIKEKTAHSVSKRQLIPGKVYRAAKVLSGDWMYVGVFDTYSQNCHLDAYDHNGKYNVNKFIQEESGCLRQKSYINWPTTRGKMIFYSMTPFRQQYAIRTDVAGIFSDEVLPDKNGMYCDSRGKTHIMYNSEMPVTFERVLDDVKGSPAFNRILFQSAFSPAACPTGVLELIFGNNNAAKAFPFELKFSAKTMRSSDGTWQKVMPQYGGSTAGLTKYRIYSDLEKIASNIGHSLFLGCSISSSKHYTTESMTLSELYDRLLPTYMQYKLENGRKLRSEHAVIFIPKHIRNIGNSLY